jgi:sec-independent protein translocase protein TatB
VFDLSLPKLLVLGVLALLIFGPDQLPKFAAQAGRAIRELRRLAEGAQADLRENLGPEFSDFEIADLHPKYFVRKHLLDDLNEDAATAAAAGSASSASPYPSSVETLTPGERPPYDTDAT